MNIWKREGEKLLHTDTVSNKVDNESKLKLIT